MKMIFERLTFWENQGQRLNFQGNFPPTTITIDAGCWLGKSVHVATFESMNLNQTSDELTVNHFATTGLMTGKGYGEKVILKFASILKCKTKIKKIHFVLSKPPSNTNKIQKSLEDVAKHRESLFYKLKMVNVDRSQKHEVSGTLVL